MQRLFWSPLSVLLMLAGMAVGAQVPNPDQHAQPTGGPPGTSSSSADATNAATAPTIVKQQITITAPLPERLLPELRPDEFRNCYGMVGDGIDYTQALNCQIQVGREEAIVIKACVNRDGKTAPRRAIQACTELLDRKLLEGRERFYLFVDRADAYFAQGDKQHALDDYNAAVKVAPDAATPYYYRGVFYAAQSDDVAALRDFDTAIGIDSKLVPALRQRAKIYQARDNFIDARQDYSKAIGLQPQTATLWSERGYICLRQQDYDNAVKDETEAIRLDPKLARAYFLRGAAAAFGRLGDSQKSSDDIKAAVDLDPSLAGYLRINDKTVSVALPPL